MEYPDAMGHPKERAVGCSLIRVVAYLLLDGANLHLPS